ncbi:hypothetical protein Norbert_39 [Paenibacillus phage Norbert]|uniref:Uncharacterized protein n=2 Tax=root TaxID=1 RepID=A0A2I7SDF5_9CAUD|nr:hypothetical protein [Paenibacillus larvae]YP_009836653.1 hypothetical protein HWB48_gp34 [Paenibacillus phage Likha]QHZ54076.1 hypothetical protein ERICV_05092 [Paenibacillus phage phiERICV]QVV20034.1 hypothetical protein Norbert_39 [Paenibacillus phage Norbert]QVV20238.1 hypothetical protein Riker_40 [Paenibacillus phage Riker]AUS03932.1 hypothetical protein LIKHA_34 [Paenibacillus phage Likha]QHZ49991.1 hypothetical protein ERICV_00814 [Paenibacillus larvae subsp. larvae]
MKIKLSSEQAKRFYSTILPEVIEIVKQKKIKTLRIEESLKKEMAAQ